MTLYMRGDQKAIYKTTQNGNTLEMHLGDKFYAVDMDKATAVELPTTFYDDIKGLSKDEQNMAIIKKALGIKEGAADPEAVILSGIRDFH